MYQAIWTPTVGEALVTQREHSNPEDAYAVAVYCVLIISASFNISDWRLALYLEQKKYDTMPSGAVIRTFTVYTHPWPGNGMPATNQYYYFFM